MPPVTHHQAPSRLRGTIYLDHVGIGWYAGRFFASSLLSVSLGVDTCVSVPLAYGVYFGVKALSNRFRQ